MLERYLIDGIIDESEEVIVRSALERKGTFRKHCRLYAATDIDQRTRLLVYDGKALYPLGYSNRAIGREVEEINIQKILGKEKAVHKIEKMMGLYSWNADSYRAMTKVYAQLESLKSLTVKTPTHCTLQPATSLSDLKAFSRLRNKFESEELGYKPSRSYRTTLDTASLRAVKPFLLRSGHKVVASVCSNLRSKEIAMVNTLYVEEEYRNRGLATLLLHQYVTFLLKNSKRVCLFYSPDNEQARRIYMRMGFKPKDMWRMTVLMVRPVFIKLAVV